MRFIDPPVAVTLECCTCQIQTIKVCFGLCALTNPQRLECLSWLSSWDWVDSFLGRAARCAGRCSPLGERGQPGGPRTPWASTTPQDAQADGHRCLLPLDSHEIQIPEMMCSFDGGLLIEMQHLSHLCPPQVMDSTVIQQRKHSKHTFDIKPF